MWLNPKKKNRSRGKLRKIKYHIEKAVLSKKNEEA